MPTAETVTPPPLSPPVSRARPRRRLLTLQNCKTGLADVIRLLEAHELEPKRANALVYAYSVLAGLIESSDLERRMSALEAADKHGAIQ